MTTDSEFTYAHWAEEGYSGLSDAEHDSEHATGDITHAHADPLRCDWDSACYAPVARIDRKGYVYCANHGIGRSRLLRPSEIRQLSHGEPLERY